MIYLASPYSHPIEAVREARYLLTVAAAGDLISAGFVIYSPIVHNHVIAKMCNMGTDFKSWRQYDILMLSRASKLWILQLDGWETSEGLREEIEFFHHTDYPDRIRYLTFDECINYVP